MNKLRFGVSGSKFKLKSSHSRVTKSKEDGFHADGKPKAKKSKMERKRIRKKAQGIKPMDQGDGRVAPKKR